MDIEENDPVAQYDPDIAPDGAAWLALDEDTRLRVVYEYHKRNGIVVSNDRLHAALHVVVENQLALGERVVIDTLSRLQMEKLSRHDAIHAIATVLSEHMFNAMKSPTNKTELASSYLADLATLTAERWMSSGDR